MTRAHPRAGATLVETAVAVAIFALLALTLMNTVSTSRRSHVVLEGLVTENRRLRDAGGALAGELRSTNGANVQVAALPDGNAEAVFQLPLPGAGAIVWGVPGRYLGGAAAADEPGWSLCYTVVEEGGERTLVRRVLDEEASVVREEVVLRGVRPGVEDPPGFGLVQAGDVWEVTLTVGQNARSEVIHAASRN